MADAEEKPRIKEVIVVEGRDDTRRLQEFYDVMTIETRGSALSDEILEEIAVANDTFGVIVFTDPDISGHKIRAAIQEAVPTVRHAFLEPEDARPKHGGSLGVEHASHGAIERALRHVYTVVSDDEAATVPAPSMAQLRTLGLIGVAGAEKRRAFLSRQLHLGHTNGKQLAKRLYFFQIPWARVEQVMAEYHEEDA